MILVFIIVCQSVLPSALSKLFGDFYCINEGFTPRSNDNQFMNYTTDLKSASKENFIDRKISGAFFLKQDVTHIGVLVQVSKRSGQNWLRQANGVEIDNACDALDKMKNFMSCFSGKLNKDDCSMNKGVFKLTNWSLEDDLKAFLEKMFYGQYKFSFMLTGIVQGKKENIMPFELIMSANDLDLKPQPSSNTEKKSKQGKSEKKKKKD